MQGKLITLHEAGEIATRNLQAELREELERERGLREYAERQITAWQEHNAELRTLAAELAQALYGLYWKPCKPMSETYKRETHAYDVLSRPEVQALLADQEAKRG